MSIRRLSFRFSSRWARMLALAAFVLPLSVPTAAWACPAGGGDEPVGFEPELSRAEALLVAAREAEDSARKEDAKARSSQQMARRQRQTAANLRERARLSPELDGDILLAKALVADREAAAADARARTSSKRAKSFRARASELRALARRLLGEDTRIL